MWFRQHTGLYFTVWRISNFDTGNGFIEDEELDGFLKEFVSSVNTDKEELEVNYSIIGKLFSPFTQ